MPQKTPEQRLADLERDFDTLLIFLSQYVADIHNAQGKGSIPDDIKARCREFAERHPFKKL
jgi:hypothetical protein